MKATKLLFVLLAIALGASAQNLVCPPNLFADSQPVYPTCIGLGNIPLAIPYSIWMVAWNDNPGNYAPGLGQPGCIYTVGGGCDDFDFNDAIEIITCNHLGNECTVVFVNPFSGWLDSVWYMGDLLFMNDVVDPTSKLIRVTPGQPIDLVLKTPEGDEYHTGPASMNTDGAVHAWVMQIGTLPVQSTD